MASESNKRRRGSDVVTVYGRRAVEEAISSPHTEVQRTALSVRAPGAYKAAFLDLCRDAGISEPEMLRDDEIGRISGDPRHAQGVVARVRLKNVTDVGPFAEERAGARQPTRLLALDGVTNPQNIGMIVRTAMAAGVSGVLWPASGSPWVNGLVIKASAGTVYGCTVVRCATLAEGIESLRASGFVSFGLDMGGESCFEHEPPHRAVYVVGSEAEGLSAGVRSVVDGVLSVPMAAGVESLNAAMAAGLLCYAIGSHGR